VEDNKADVYLIRHAIAQAQIDADLHIVRDGSAAVQFLNSADQDPNAPVPDLILLDLNLPKKNGNEFLRDLRNVTRYQDALVVVVTSSDSQRDREAAAALGVAGYFRKPSDFEEFMKLGPLVRALLGDEGHGHA
jgi:CheY-like chemotaxis protein